MICLKTKNQNIKWLYKQIVYNLQNQPIFHSEERLVNLAIGRECFVVLSILLVYHRNQFMLNLKNKQQYYQLV